MLHALIAITAPAGRFHAGERYTVPEDTAAELIRAGVATPVEVPEQRIEDGSVPGAGDRAELLEHLQALVPAPPPDPAAEHVPIATAPPAPTEES